MHRNVFKKRWAVILCLFILGCNSQHNAGIENDTVISTNIPHAIKSPVKDSTQKNSKYSVDTVARQITAADQQYLALMIPDYSEIVLQHETGIETLKYVNALKQYFISKKCSINGDDIIKDSGKEIKNKRFYIQHVGDNRFVITVYNEYGNEHHP